MYRLQIFTMLKGTLKIQTHSVPLESIRKFKI